MFNSNKKNILDPKHKNNTPLLPSNSKGEKIKLGINMTQQIVRLKKIKDINGMQITYNVIKKKN
tara:strand:- start:197 stop:388 length:192 start_codon:yes stop_codon:yes gene_type:complete